MAERKRSSRAREAEARARQAQAEADARIAEANAKAAAAKAEADAKAAAARVEADRVAAERAKQSAADRRAQERADAQRDAQDFRSIATGIGIVAGLGAGKGLSHLVDKRFVASTTAKNVQLERLATAASSVGAPAASAAARQTGIGRARAPLGLGLAGALLAEAAVARFVISPAQADSPRAQATTDAFAQGSTLAAFALVGQQSINRATPKVALDAKALAVISAPPPVAAAPAARATAAQKPGTVPALRAEAKSLGIAVGKMKKAELEKAIAAAKPAVAAPAAPAGGLRRLLARSMPAVAAVVFGAAGYVQSAKAGGSQADAAKAGAKAAADALTGGAVSAGEAEQRRSGSTGLAVIRGAVEGVGNIMTLGLAGMIAAHTEGRPTIKYVPESVQKRLDREKAEAGKSDAGGRVAQGAAGAAMIAMGRHTMKDAGRFGSGQRGMKAAGKLGGAGMILTGAVTLAGALAGKSNSSPAYLNAGAAAKAAATPAAAPARQAMPGRPAMSGGLISYTTLDGRTVQATRAQAARWQKQRK